MLKDWDACAREVGHALSRYNGQTTYSKLSTILSVPESSLFTEGASWLAAVLSKKAQEQHAIGARASHVALAHGINLGFLHRATPGDPSQARIALTPLGRAYRAALDLKDDGFRDFLLGGTMLDSDFDMYGMLLKHAYEHGGTVPSKEAFQASVGSLFEQRRNWLSDNVPSPVVRDKLGARVQWMRGKGSLDRLTLGYHWSNRQQWAKHLEHVDGNNCLTPLGRDTYEKHVQPVALHNSMFWLAPDAKCIRKVGIVFRKPEMFCSGWDLYRPSNLVPEPSDDLVGKVSDFMERAFPTLRLHAFPQAPLASVLFYVRYQEMLLGYKTSWPTLFRKVLHVRGKTLHCVLTGVIEDSQYQLVQSANQSKSRNRKSFAHVCFGMNS